MKANYQQCFESWSQELKSRSDRVRSLIGDAHWLSDGHHKEELIREFLCRYLPARFRVTRGFICAADPAENVSREIDVLVADSEAELPWFSEGNLTIVPPSSAVGQIHVKTEFATRELADVLISGAHNQRVFQTSVSDRPLWFGAIFYSRTIAATNSQLQKVWKNAVLKARRHGLGRSQFPDCVVIVDGPTFLPDKNGKDSAGIKIRAYECGAAAPAVFLSHLYESMTTTGKDPTRRGEWFRMISTICKGTLYTQRI